MKPRWTMAAVVFGVVACVAYAVQRLIDAATEPPAGVIIEQVHIPYYWRMALSGLIAVVAATLAALGLPLKVADRLLNPWIVVGLVALSAVAMLVVP